MDKTAFFMGSYAEADIRAGGSDMTLEERLAWSNKAAKAFYGYAPSQPLKIDRAAFSARKHK
jgi:hypothetical protein